MRERTAAGILEHGLPDGYATKELACIAAAAAHSIQIPGRFKAEHLFETDVRVAESVVVGLPHIAERFLPGVAF